MKDWVEVSAKLFNYLLALWWNGILGYLVVSGQEIAPWFWVVYGAIMAAVGIPVAYSGVKILKRGRQ